MVISGKTTLIGLFGYPVEHSFSPVMHNAAFKALGLDYAYVPFKVAPTCLEDAVRGIRALGLRGVNVTIPHKEKVIRYLDSVTEEASIIGAVNTIVNTDGKLTGHNTDGIGFVRSLAEAGVDPNGITAVIIGAGGAARAVAVQLALEGAEKVCVYAREQDMQAAKSIVQVITDKTAASSKAVIISDGEPVTDLKGKVLVINCTPLGMHPAENRIPPVDLASLPSTAVISDLVYNPRETLLLREARRLGLKVVPGLGMLLFQGAVAFQHWTGREAPVDIMQEALDTVCP